MAKDGYKSYSLKDELAKDLEELGKKWAADAGLSEPYTVPKVIDIMRNKLKENEPANA